jgi:hypothetical protein
VIAAPTASSSLATPLANEATEAQIPRWAFWFSS